MDARRNREWRGFVGFNGQELRLIHRDPSADGDEVERRRVTDARPRGGEGRPGPSARRAWTQTSRAGDSPRRSHWRVTGPRPGLRSAAPLRPKEYAVPHPPVDTRHC